MSQPLPDIRVPSQKSSEADEGLGDEGPNGCYHSAFRFASCEQLSNEDLRLGLQCNKAFFKWQFLAVVGFFGRSFVELKRNVCWYFDTVKQYRNRSGTV